MVIWVNQGCAILSGKITGAYWLKIDDRYTVELLVAGNRIPTGISLKTEKEAIAYIEDVLKWYKKVPNHD